MRPLARRGSLNNLHAACVEFIAMPQLLGLGVGLACFTKFKIKYDNLARYAALGDAVKQSAEQFVRKGIELYSLSLPLSLITTTRTQCSLCFVLNEIHTRNFARQYSFSSFRTFRNLRTVAQKVQLAVLAREWCGDAHFCAVVPLREIILNLRSNLRLAFAASDVYVTANRNVRELLKIHRNSLYK